MQTKKNLNGIQRKMLDEIYSEEFKKKSEVILEGRRVEYAKLQASLLAKESKGREVKAMLDAGQKFYELSQKLKSELAAKGVVVENYISGAPKLAVNSYRADGRFPELEEYQAETYKIESALASKKREMRAKIYGVDASYEVVDAEIKELLKDI